MNRIAIVLIYTLILLPINLAFTQDQGTFFPFNDGLIPKGFGGDIAEDLVFQGENKTPEQLYELYHQWNKKLDLSELEPIQETSYWKKLDQIPSAQELKKLDTEIGIKDHDTVIYQSFGSSEEGDQGEASFDVIFPGGQYPFYTIYIGPLIHQYLMRKTLLRKLGYEIPALKRVSKLKIEFQSVDQKEDFILALESQFVDIDAWVINNPEDQPVLYLQDLIVEKAGLEAFYNLALAAEKGSITKRWRLFSSLSIPYNLLNYPESINLFKWHSCRVYSNNVQLQLDDAPLFNTTYEDARWITRKINQLSREDWKEVVASSELPGPIQAVLLEKIISRRNGNNRCFDLDEAPLILHPMVNAGEYVVDSKILKAHWDGFGPSFSFKDPESPLSSSQMTSFLLSKAYGLLFKGFSQAFNEFVPLMKTDISQKNNENIQSIIDKIEAQSAITGEQQKLPLSTWMFPHYRANIILNRQIVAGPYQGTDNILSQVDSIGFSFAAGKYMGVTGILPNGQGDKLVSQGASATLNGSISRIYSHVSPVSSVKEALKKYPFQDLFIPKYKNKIGNIFTSFQSTTCEKQIETDECEEDPSLKDGLLKELEEFKNNFREKESIIITDTIGAALGASASFQLYKFIRIDPSFLSNSVVLNRIHIYRKDENTIHIYKNFGNINGIQVNVKINAGIPVISAQVNGNRGQAKTDMYILSIDPKHKDIERNIIALKRVFKTASLKYLKKLRKPYEFKYKFREKLTRLRIFAFHFNKIKSTNNISVKSPSGTKRSFIRHYLAKADGVNIFDYGLDAAKSIVDLIKKTNISLSTPPFNPGFQFSGRAKTKEIVYEVEPEANYRMIKITRAYNGWKHENKQILQKLQYLRNHYRYNFYDPQDLQHTKNIFLYNINVNIYIYQKGIDHLMNISSEELKNIYLKNKNRKYITINNDIDEDNTSYRKLLRLRKRYLKFKNKKKSKKTIRNLLKIVDHMEKNLTIRGLGKLVGGQDNFFVFANIIGFREGEEFNIDEPYLVSHTLGQLGEFATEGPLTPIQRKTGITPGELYINWILKRAL